MEGNIRYLEICRSIQNNIFFNRKLKINLEWLTNEDS